MAATDALGRKVREFKDAGEKRKDKFVAMFYWTWHQGNDDTTYEVKNISEIVRNYPEAMKDYNHPAWGDKKPGFFFWEQPLFDITRQPIRGYFASMQNCLQMQVWMLFFLIVQTGISQAESYEALLKTRTKHVKTGLRSRK